MGHIACLMSLIGDGCNAADRPKPDTYDWAWEQTKAERERERERSKRKPEERFSPWTSRWALQNKNCVCSKAGISFRAMESAATIPHAHGVHCDDEAWADDEGG